MFKFPFLQSLVKNNDHCRSLFLRTVKWENENKMMSSELEQQCERNTRQVSGDEAKMQEDESLEKTVVHWKKAVKLKFQVENEVEVLQPEVNLQEDKMESLKDWELRSILRPNCASKPTDPVGVPTITEIHCKICEKIFETRRLLSQHKRLEHFPSWEGVNKEFCYVPYFVEPKRFNLLRGTLDSEQLECKLCQKWLGGGVKQKVGPYLDDLRTKIKEKAAEKMVQKDEASPALSSPCKRRGRKCKSMSRRVCELCSKILSNRKGLERHMLIHTGEKPFPCDICGKPFRRKDNCVRHKKTAHLFKKPRKPRRRKATVPTVNTFTDNSRSSYPVYTANNPNQSASTQQQQ